MEEYSTLLAPFSSFFQLAVAFNFSYVASKQLRDSLKKGFLHSAHTLESLYEEKKNELEAKLEVLKDEDLASDDKKNIKKELTIKLDQFRAEYHNLESKIEENQDITALKIEPLYIHTALISLYFLFLGGIEAINNTFPRNELFTLLTLSSIYISFSYYLAFSSSHKITAAFSSSITIIFCIFSILHPVEIPPSFTLNMTKYIPNILGLIPSTNLFFFPYSYISNHGLLFYSLTLSFFPFVLASVSLLVINFRLEYKFKSRYTKHLQEINELKSHLDSLSETRNIIKNFSGSHK